MCSGGNGLAVPVVDLLDVPEDHLVFAPHVLRDPSNLQPGHEALGRNKRCQRSILLEKKPMTTPRQVYLHDDAQVLHVVLLGLDHLVNHKPAAPPNHIHSDYFALGCD